MTRKTLTVKAILVLVAFTALFAGYRIGADFAQNQNKENAGAALAD